MLIKGGCVHNGRGYVGVCDIRIENGLIQEMGEMLQERPAEEIVCAQGMEILPGFIQGLSNWGINGSMTEIRPSSNDNAELSSPVYPELDVVYAFNGRAMTTQQLGAFGVTAVGVAPEDSNLFGGQMAVFEVDGVNPMKMCLKEKVGLKASVTSEVKTVYGSRKTAPMTKMWLFEALGAQFRKAAQYDKEKQDEKTDKKPSFDPKMEVLCKVLKKELPLFISCDHKADIYRVRDVLKFYDIRMTICNGNGLDGSETDLIDENTSLIARWPMDLMKTDQIPVCARGIARLADQGMLIALGGINGNMSPRAECLWAAYEMLKVMKDPEKVLPMITYNPAKILGVDQMTGSLEPGKRADLVIWSKHPLKSWQAQVLLTLQSGKVIYKKGDVMRCM